MIEDWDEYCEAYEGWGWLGGVEKDICRETRAKMLAAIAAEREKVKALREAIQTHSECVTVCDRCGNEMDNATDDVCRALAADVKEQG
jgi:hypothetical protein